MIEGIGVRIRDIRKNNNLTQKRFAELLGISQTHISKIEKGIENPSDTLIILISHLFFTNQEWLKTGTVDNKKKNDPMFERYLMARYLFEESLTKFNHDSLWNSADALFSLTKILTNDMYKLDPIEMQNYTEHIKNITGLLFVSVHAIDESRIKSEKNKTNNSRAILELNYKLSSLKEKINNEISEFYHDLLRSHNLNIES